MKNKVNIIDNFTTTNGGVPLFDDEVERLIAVRPSERQLQHALHPFYLFIHFGMNTATGREWGNGTETISDFSITSVDVNQWVSVAQESGAAGIIFTAKHHDGFCLWDTKQTDFNVMNSPFGQDIVKLLSDECRKAELMFGVYLSPWDMHEKTYGTDAYNDYYCAQLTELCSNYGELFEVWLDGAKGSNAPKFEYDWERYYSVVRALQPGACISICGPDLRWVGNEGGKSRKSEFSVVPAVLCDAEKTHEKSQHGETDAKRLKMSSSDEDLGSREALKNHEELVWYPAEVDVSVRKGWFFPGGGRTKSAKKLFKIYLTSVGNNCSLLLNVPPNKQGKFTEKDVKALRGLAKKISAFDQKPKFSLNGVEIRLEKGYIELELDEKRLSYAVIEEDIALGQRVESFELFLLKKGKVVFSHKGTVIGSRCIVPLKGRKADKAVFVIRQSRSEPKLKNLKIYR